MHFEIGGRADYNVPSMTLDAIGRLHRRDASEHRVVSRRNGVHQLPCGLFHDAIPCTAEVKVGNTSGRTMKGAYELKPNVI